MAAAIKDIRTLIRSRTIFGKLTEKELDAQRKALMYIELVAMQANIPILGWDITEVFKASKGSKKILTNPSQINKRLFTTHESTKDLNKKLALLDVYENAELLRQVAKKPNENEILNCSHQVTEYEGYLKTAETNNNLIDIKNYKRDLKHLKVRLATLKKVPDIYNDVLRIVTEGFWRLLSVDVDCGIVSFITSNHVVLFDKNAKSKLNIHKDIGVLRADFIIDRWAIYIEPFKGNTIIHDEGDYEDDYGYTRSSGYIHPYVSSGGVCFGNAGKVFEGARTERDLYNMMNIMGNVLSTYNAGNGPHITLYQFTKKSSSADDQTFIKLTPDAKKYYERRKKQESTIDKRLAEVTPKFDDKDTKETTNLLAKAAGRKPESLASQIHDDDEDDDLMYEDDEENEDENYDGN